MRVDRSVPGLMFIDERGSDPAPALNVDRHGMPRDYATYVWLLYGKRVRDDSPQRIAFLAGHVDTFADAMGQVLMADPEIMGTMLR